MSESQNQNQRPGSRRYWRRALGTLFSLALFSGAVWVLYREAAKYGFERIWQTIAGFTARELVLAGLLTIVCYWILTFYDWMAFHYVGYKIAYRRLTFGASIAYAFGNNIGLANFAGAAVRYRLYSAWDIAPTIIGKVVALDILSNWLGFLITTGLVFTLIPPPIPAVSHLPIGSARPLGLLFLAPVVLYALLSLVRARPFVIGKLRFPLLRNPMFAAQIIVACFDFALGGVVLYVLLPHQPSLHYGAFLGVYLLAQATAILSHVPGGLGVFESVILFSLTPRYSSPDVLGALLAYRVIYFFVPFAIASVCFAGFEIRNRARVPKA